MTPPRMFSGDIWSPPWHSRQWSQCAERSSYCHSLPFLFSFLLEWLAAYLKVFSLIQTHTVKTTGGGAVFEEFFHKNGSLLTDWLYVSSSCLSGPCCSPACHSHWLIITVISSSAIKAYWKSSTPLWKVITYIALRTSTLWHRPCLLLASFDTEYLSDFSRPKDQPLQPERPSQLVTQKSFLQLRHWHAFSSSPFTVQIMIAQYFQKLFQILFHSWTCILPSRVWHSMVQWSI